MKKVFLLLVLALLVVPTVFGLENVIPFAYGNDTELFFSITTVQSTTNPTIGANIAYVTTINVTAAGASVTWNLTNFTYYLPDNASTQTLTDFKLNGNTSFVVQNATSFTESYRNYVNFTIPDALLNDTGNGTFITINWSLSSPIAQSKIGVVQAGRRYTETWNITSSASNLTIVNASLVVLPTYWHTRIGSPTVTFNSTSKNSVSTLGSISVYTDLNISNSDDVLGNMIKYGSGWSTLGISYDGPTVDASSGKSATTVTTGIIPEETKRIIAFWWLIGIGAVLMISGTAGLIYFLTKKRY